MLNADRTAYIGNKEYGLIEPTHYDYLELKRVHNSEGYSVIDGRFNDDCKYYYYRRDHLDNVREAWKPSGDSTLTVQSTRYYPGGLPWEYQAGDSASLQPYKHNSKEFIEMHGLNEYYSVFRNYYPAISRFTTVDALAELTPHLSPYHSNLNNPVRYTDPLGLQAQDIWGRDKFDKNGMYIPPMDRPGGLAASGYGNPLYGYFTDTYKTYYGYNYMSQDEGKHEKYFFYSQTVKTGQTFVWNPLMHQEEEFKFPTYNRNHAITPLYIEFDIITAWRGLVNAAVKTAVGSAAKKGGMKAVFQFSNSTIDDAVGFIMKDPNKLNHLFSAKHNLGNLVSKLGGQENTVRSILKAANGKLPSSGMFNDIAVNVGGQTVFIRGSVINGVPRLGTMYIP